MKILLSSFILLVSVALSGQAEKDTIKQFKINKLKKMELVTFDIKPKLGYIKELKVDSISMILVDNSQDDVAVEDIHFMKFGSTSNKRGGRTLAGVLLGAIPGIIYLSTVDERNTGITSLITAPADAVLGLGLTLGGSLLGGIIGYNIGNKNGAVTIPINGSQTLYQKQKEKIKSLAF
jgi:hypothetical protein